MEKTQVFREKNLNRITSAEDLHECMHVTSPRLWMLLSAILVLVVGFIVFACLVTMENTLPVTASVTNYTDEEGYHFYGIEIQLPESIGDVVQRGSTVRIGDREGYVSGLYNNEWLGKGVDVQMNDPLDFLEAGEYDAEIVLERISPIRFLLN